MVDRRAAVKKVHKFFFAQSSSKEVREGNGAVRSGQVLTESALR
jgi:hypothetical protein